MGIINREAFIESNKIVEYLLATKEMFGNKVWVFFVNDSRILDTFTMLQISLGGRCANISIKVSLFARTLKKKKCFLLITVKNAQQCLGKKTQDLEEDLSMQV